MKRMLRLVCIFMGVIVGDGRVVPAEGNRGVSLEIPKSGGGATECRTGGWLQEGPIGLRD